MTTKEEAREIIKARCGSGPVKLYVGNGYEYWEGFVNIDLNPECSTSDIYADCVEMPFLDDNSVDEIHTYHTVEHLGWRRIVPAFLEWRRILKPGGKIILEMPDLGEIIDRFQKLRLNSGEIQGDFGDNSIYNTLYGGQQDQGSFHISCLTKYQLMSLLKAAGFEEIENGEYKIIFEIPRKGKEYGPTWNIRAVAIK